MRLSTVALISSLAWTGPAYAINIVSSNDDGWAEANIHTFFQALTAAGHPTVVSAPALDQSGTGE